MPPCAPTWIPRADLRRTCSTKSLCLVLIPSVFRLVSGVALAICHHQGHHPRYRSNLARRFLRRQNKILRSSSHQARAAAQKKPTASAVDSMENVLKVDAHALNTTTHPLQLGHATSGARRVGAHFSNTKFCEWGFYVIEYNVTVLP